MKFKLGDRVYHVYHPNRRAIFLWTGPSYDVVDIWFEDHDWKIPYRAYEYNIKLWVNEWTTT